MESVQKQSNHFNIYPRTLWALSSIAITLYSAAACVFVGLHSITAAGMWLRSTPPPTPTELVQLSIEHTGIRKLTLENGLNDGTKITLSRSKRNTSHYSKGTIQTHVKHMHALKSAFIQLDSDTKSCANTKITSLNATKTIALYD